MTGAAAGEPTPGAAAQEGGAPAPPAASRLLGGLPIDAIVLGASLFLLVAATNILTPLLPMVRDEFGVSITTAGIIVGAFGLARLVVDIPAALLVDRLGHRRIAVLAIVILAASAVLGYGAASVEALVAARIGSGLAVGILATVILSALSATATVANRGKVMSLFHVANNTGIALYPLAGGLIGVASGWRTTFAVTAAFALLAALLLLPVLTRVSFHAGSGAGRGASDEGRVLHGRQRTVAILATNLGVAANMIHRHGIRNTILPLYAATVLALGPFQIATAIALMSATGLLVATPGGMLGDRIGRRRVITAGLAAIAAGDLAFILTGDLASFLLIAALIGFGDFFTSSQTALLSEIVPLRLRTRALSSYRFSADLGALVGPVLLAAVMDRGGSTAAVLTAVAILVTASAAAWFLVPSRAEATPESVPAA